MPLTLWSEIKGYRCINCDDWATHFYVNVPICCQCHCGDSLLKEEARVLNEEGEEAFDRLFGDHSQGLNPPL